MAKKGGVGVVRPSLGPKQQIGQQQLYEGVVDPLRRSARASTRILRLNFD